MYIQGDRGLMLSIHKTLKRSAQNLRGQAKSALVSDEDQPYEYAKFLGDIDSQSKQPLTYPSTIAQGLYASGTLMCTL